MIVCQPRLGRSAAEGGSVRRDGRLIRTIQGTVPSVTYASETAVLNATRDADGTANSTALITDFLFDAAGRKTAQIDPRGIETEFEYDSRNRLVRETRAEGTAVEAVTETDYDDQGNVVEVRHPRYFDSADTNGYQKCKITMTYTGRNRLASRTEAPGTAAAATESFTYTLDGRLAVHTDFRGNDWETLWPSCCERQQVNVDPLGHGAIRNTDAAGHVTHQNHRLHGYRQRHDRDGL